MTIIERGILTDDTDLEQLTKRVSGIVCIQQAEFLSEWRLLKDPVNGATHLYIGDGSEEKYQEWIRKLV